MPIPAQFQEMLNNLTAQLPLWVDGVFVLLAIWGLMLWLSGRRIVKLSFTFIGLLSGAAAGAAIMHAVRPESSVLLGVIIGSVAGVVISWVAFRLWMALVLAIVAFLLAPWCVAAWQGTEPINPAKPIEDVSRQIVHEQVAQVQEAVRGALPLDLTNPQAPSETPGDPDDEKADEPARSVGDILRETVDRYRQAWAAWWGELGLAARWSLVGVGAIAAACAFAFGLVFPNLGASTVSALAGSVMVLTALGRLGTRYLPGVVEYLPTSPRAMLIAVALAAGLGVLIQWIFSRKSADE